MARIATESPIDIAPQMIATSIFDHVTTTAAREIDLNEMTIEKTMPMTSDDRHDEIGMTATITTKSISSLIAVEAPNLATIVQVAMMTDDTPLATIDDNETTAPVDEVRAVAVTTDSQADAAIVLMVIANSQAPEDTARMTATATDIILADTDMDTADSITTDTKDLPIMNGAIIAATTEDDRNLLAVHVTISEDIAATFIIMDTIDITPTASSRMLIDIMATTTATSLTTVDTIMDDITNSRAAMEVDTVTVSADVISADMKVAVGVDIISLVEPMAVLPHGNNQADLVIPVLLA